MKELNLGKPSYNQVKKDNKFRADAANFMDNYNKSLMESEEEKRLSEENSAMSGARFGYASTLERSKNRINSLNEEIRYNNTSSIIGMTEMVARVVEEALLLDEEEYAALNPNYRTEIREIISGFLTEGNINEEINNPETLRIMEHVARSLPNVKIGKTLTEEEIAKKVSDDTSKEVDASIKGLSRNVSKKVAKIVDDEKKKADKINADVKKSQKADEEAPVEEAEEYSADELIEAIANEELSVEELDAMLENGEISEEVYNEVHDALESTGIMTGEQPIPEEEGEAMEEMPEEAGMEQPAGKSIHIDPDGTTSISMPNGQLALNGDGSMDIQLMEKVLVRETMRCGLIESLAVNEARNMLDEGKGYNPDLCLANAIMYVTVTEAMNEMGLMNVGEKEYSHIISAAGGSIRENLEGKGTTVGDKQKKGTNPTEVKGNVPSVNYKLQSKNPKVGNSVSPSKHFEQNVDRKEFPNYVKPVAGLNHVSPKTNPKSNLTESVICSQHVPALNSSYESESLAERLRRKRLNEEQNKTLHD